MGRAEAASRAGVDPEDGPAGCTAGLGQCLQRMGWHIIPIVGLFQLTRAGGVQPCPIPPAAASTGLLRICLFCHVVVTCICKEFQVIPWFQISSKCLLPASTFISLAQILPSECSTSPLDSPSSNKTHRLPSLPCPCKCSSSP